jgi:hypothetical protein
LLLCRNGTSLTALVDSGLSVCNPLLYGADGVTFSTTRLT